MPLQIVSLVLFAIVSVYALVLIAPEMDPALAVPRYLFAILVVAGLVAALYLGKVKGCDLGAFLSQSVSSFSLTGLLACSMFPNLVVASEGSVGPTLTLMNASASELSLFYMIVIVCIGLPLVLVYHVIVYRTFRGRVSVADSAE